MPRPQAPVLPHDAARPAAACLQRAAAPRGFSVLHLVLVAILAFLVSWAQPRKSYWQTLVPCRLLALTHRLA